MIPRSGPAVAGIVTIAAVAFLLGGVLLGEGGRQVRPSTAPSDEGGTVTGRATVWTCSMHPQIRMPGPGKCPICFMDLIPVDTQAGDTLEPRQLRLSAAARQLAQIETAVVRRGYAERSVRMVGRIAYDESRVATITAWVPGRLDRLYADFTGITVSKGDHMVSMYSPELFAAQEELLQAVVSAESLQASESAVLRSSAVATRTAAREKLRLYGLTEQQIDGIISTGAPSEELTVNAPIGGVVIQKEALEGMYVQTGTRIYTIADLSTLWVLFEAYESDLPWLRYGQHVDFTSPSFPGERFEAIISFIDPVVDAATRTVHVRAILDNASRRLKPDMFVRGTVRSRLNSRGEVVDNALAGKWISPMHPEIVKEGPGACDVCGMPLVPAEQLGYASSTRTNARAPLLIPASAPLLTGKRAVVYVELPAQDGPLFEGREVILGPRAGDFYVVQSGLEEGERVVTNGAFKIDSELQIRARPSMMSPDERPGSQSKTETPGPGDSSVASNGPFAGSAHGGLVGLFDRYFQAQAALARDDLGGAESAFRAFRSAVSDGLLAAGPGRVSSSLLDRLERSSSNAAAADDLAEARAAFYDLSQAVIELQGIVGNPMPRSMYLAYCPMARDYEGASWLQTSDRIANPYYGKAMLRCGEIQATLPGTPERSTDR